MNTLNWPVPLEKRNLDICSAVITVPCEKDILKHRKFDFMVSAYVSYPYQKLQKCFDHYKAFFKQPPASPLILNRFILMAFSVQVHAGNTVLPY